MIKLMLFILGISVDAYGHGPKHLSDSQLATAMEEKLRTGLLGNSWSNLMDHPIFEQTSTKKETYVSIEQQMNQEERLFRFENKLQRALNNIYKTHYYHRGQTHHVIPASFLFNDENKQPAKLKSTRVQKPIRKHKSAQLIWSTFANSLNNPVEWIPMFYRNRLYQ
jgi:hypothetical protein